MGLRQGPQVLRTRASLYALRNGGRDSPAVMRLYRVLLRRVWQESRDDES